MRNIQIAVLLISVSAFWFLSCDDDRDKTTNADIRFSNEALCDEIASAQAYLCTEFSAEKDTLESRLRAALLKNKRWKTGQTIKIKFLNGSQYLQGNVKEHASVWLKYANLKFEYVDANAAADIKIAFKWNCDYGSWSYVGTDNKQISCYKPSINFGWFNEFTPRHEFQRVVLHEFGHALGLVHEHQNPSADIQWDKPAVYAHYETLGTWTRKDVNQNIFKKYSTSQTNYTSFDDKSIMLYSISNKLTLNGYAVGWNRELSEMDKKFISQIYPY